MGWLDPAFTPPERLELHTGDHLRQIRESDVDIDYPAVMGSQRRLWEKYGDVFGWPPATMSYESDKGDLARHEREMAALESFNYAVLDERETRLLGCIYIDPPKTDSPPGSDAMVSWWVIDELVGTALESSLDEAIPRWLTAAWGFEAVHYHP